MLEEMRKQKEEMEINTLRSPKLNKKSLEILSFKER
jgi:hypothetical protein